MPARLAMAAIVREFTPWDPMYLNGAWTISSLRMRVLFLRQHGSPYANYYSHNSWVNSKRQPLIMDSPLVPERGPSAARDCSALLSRSSMQKRVKCSRRSPMRHGMALHQHVGRLPHAFLAARYTKATKSKRAAAYDRNPLLLLVEMNGIEPSTYALRTHRSPS